METIRSIIELTLAIDCLLISIKLIKLSNQVRKLEQEIRYLYLKEKEK